MVNKEELQEMKMIAIDSGVHCVAEGDYNLLHNTTNGKAYRVAPGG